MAKVNVANRTSARANGEVFRHTDGEYYVVVSLAGEKALVGLHNWNRWSSTSLFGNSEGAFRFVGMADEVIVK